MSILCPSRPDSLRKCWPVSHPLTFDDALRSPGCFSSGTKRNRHSTSCCCLQADPACHPQFDTPSALMGMWGHLPWYNLLADINTHKQSICFFFLVFGCQLFFPPNTAARKLSPCNTFTVKSRSVSCPMETIASGYLVLTWQSTHGTERCVAVAGKIMACDLKMCQQMLMRFVAMLFLSLYRKQISSEGWGILCSMGVTPWKPVLVWDSSKESTNLDGLLHWQPTAAYGRDLRDLTLVSAELWWAGVIPPTPLESASSKGQDRIPFLVQTCVSLLNPIAARFLFYTTKVVSEDSRQGILRICWEVAIGIERKHLEIFPLLWSFK